MAVTTIWAVQRSSRGWARHLQRPCCLYRNRRDNDTGRKLHPRNAGMNNTKGKRLNPPTPRQSRPPARGVAAKSNFLSVTEFTTTETVEYMIIARQRKSVDTISAVIARGVLGSATWIGTVFTMVNLDPANLLMEWSTVTTYEDELGVKSRTTPQKGRSYEDTKNVCRCSKETGTPQGTTPAGGGK